MTCYPTLRLECDGLESLVIDDAAGLYVSKVDLGNAVTRSVVQDAVDADGTDDSTTHTGARNVTLQLSIFPDVDTETLWTLRNRLRSFTSPRIRPVLFIQQSVDAPEQRVVLRRSDYTDVLASSNVDWAPIVAQWVAPSGIIESAEEHAVSVFAAGGTTAGRTYSLTFSRVYPASAPLGTGTIINAGTADAYPLLRIYGPLTEPEVTSITQGKSLVFAGLTLAAGEFLEIDTRAKTIYLNGDPTASRYSKLVFPDSQWFTLSPGENEVWLHPATYTAAVSLVEFTYRDAWL